MTYQLFLDDVRDVTWVYPLTDPNAWVVCRSFSEALDVFKKQGWPHHVSFDHDLGDQTPTGYDFAKFLVDSDLDFDSMPYNFTFTVHSANPVGAANIQGLLDAYLNQKQ